MVVDGRLQDDLAERVEVAAERLLVAVGDLVRLGEDRGAAFHVEEPHRPAEGEAQLPGVEQVEDRDVMLAEPQVLEAASEQLGLDEQVGEDHDQGALADRLGQLVEDAGEVGLALAVGRASRASKIAIRCAGFRRGGMFRTTPPATQARPTASPCWRARCPATPAIRRAYSILVTSPEPKSIEPLVSTHQAAPEVRVGLELLDEEPIRPAVGPPVEPPEVVAGDVLAILGELDARPPVRAGMPARDAPLHRPRANSGRAASRDRTTGSRKLRGLRSGIIGGRCSRMGGGHRGQHGRSDDGR